MTRIRIAAVVAAVGFSFVPAPVRHDAAAAGPATAAAPEWESRVVNGVLAQDRPATGALLGTSGINHHIICSGTLIGCETFLTAAHCVCDESPFSACGTPNAGQYSVYLQNVGIVGVASIDVDPSYTFGTGGDVAVLTLATPVTGVAPMPINTSMRPPYGTTVEIAGFGLTRGGADDTGLLRRGIAETSMCLAAEDSAHVCWAFSAPLGMPGLDSNTCNGDSGGPLFADLGSGTTVVGVTSGGTSGDCLPGDSSYDTDVYVHRAWIQGIGGADLANTSCGSIAQVGEAGSVLATFDFDTLSRAAQSCRKELSKQYSTYTAAALRAHRSCLDGVADGSRTAPCPDAEANGELDRAIAKVSVEKLLSRCPDDIAPTIMADGLCAGAADASALAACILAAGNAAVASALDSQYANNNPMGAIADVDARDCQEAVGAASAGLLRSTLKSVVKCQVSLASGKVAACPDAKTSAAVTKAETKAGERIGGVCSDDDVALLDGSGTFGGSCGGVLSAAALAACQIADHAVIREDLRALLTDQSMETDVAFTVAPGVALLRVTLNGRDNGNDLDLYIRAGAPATMSAYNERSENGGMFEETEVASPAAGTWYAHLERYSGDTLMPYQLTATTFEP